jgi:hypothetical protein
MGKVILFFTTLAILSSCSDAMKGRFSALGNGRAIKCFSGGTLIYEGKSTGKINSEEGSDGYYFTDINGKYVEVNADCLLTVEE